MEHGQASIGSKPFKIILRNFEARLKTDLEVTKQIVLSLSRGALTAEQAYAEPTQRKNGQDLKRNCERVACCSFDHLLPLVTRLNRRVGFWSVSTALPYVIRHDL